MELVNLTPHPVGVVHGDEIVTIAPDPRGPARFGMNEGETVVQDGVTFVELFPETHQVTGLPDPEEGVRYIVALPLALALAGIRDDLVVVHRVQRNEKGQPTHAEALGRI